MDSGRFEQVYRSRTVCPRRSGIRGCTVVYRTRAGPRPRETRVLDRFCVQPSPGAAVGKRHRLPPYAVANFSSSPGPLVILPPFGAPPRGSPLQWALLYRPRDPAPAPRPRPGLSLGDIRHGGWLQFFGGFVGFVSARRSRSTCSFCSMRSQQRTPWKIARQPQFPRPKYTGHEFARSCQFMLPAEPQQVKPNQQIQAMQWCKLPRHHQIRRVGPCRDDPEITG